MTKYFSYALAIFGMASVFMGCSEDITVPVVENKEQSVVEQPIQDFRIRFSGCDRDKGFVISFYNYPHDGQSSEYLNEYIAGDYHEATPTEPESGTRNLELDMHNCEFADTISPVERIITCRNMNLSNGDKLELVLENSPNLAIQGCQFEIQKVNSNGDWETYSTIARDLEGHTARFWRFLPYENEVKILQDLSYDPY